MIDNPSLLEMDDNSEHMGDKDGEGEEGRPDFMQEDNDQMGGGTGANLEVHQGSKEHQGGKHKNTDMQHSHDLPKVEEERVQWEIEEANDGMGIECFDERGAALNGQMADALDGELGTPSAHAQKALAAIPEAVLHHAEARGGRSQMISHPLSRRRRLKRHVTSILL
jgi:hypothetical protein